MNNVVRERVESARARIGAWELASEERVRAEVARLRESQRTGLHRPATARATRDDDPSSVRRWLRELPVDEGERVLVIWPGLSSGILLAYSGFVEAYDDLWFPGADDVWVRPISGDWLLELDHEEVVRFFPSLAPAGTQV